MRRSYSNRYRDNSTDVEWQAVKLSMDNEFPIKPAFHDTDTDILARILADTSDTRDFLKLFL